MSRPIMPTVCSEIGDVLADGRNYQHCCHSLSLPDGRRMHLARWPAKSVIYVRYVVAFRRDAAICEIVSGSHVWLSTRYRRSIFGMLKQLDWSMSDNILLC